MEEGWTKVYTAEEEYQSALIKTLLEKSGLNPVVLDRKDDGFRLGNVEIYVAPEEAEKALNTIKYNQTQG